MKRSAADLLAALQARAEQLASGEPVLVLLYLDDVVVAVPRAVTGDVLPLAQQAFGPGLDATAGPGLTLRPDKCEAWSPNGGRRPRDLPSVLEWRESGFVILGAAHRDGQAEDGIALLVRTPHGSGPLRRQWTSTVDSVVDLGARVLQLVERAIEIGQAQKGAVLNTAQCACLLLRFCVESKLAYLLRALPPDALGSLVEDASIRIQNLFLQAIASSGGLTAE